MVLSIGSLTENSFKRSNKWFFNYLARKEQLARIGSCPLVEFSFVRTRTTSWSPLRGRNTSWVPRCLLPTTYFVDHFCGPLRAGNIYIFRRIKICWPHSLKSEYIAQIFGKIFLRLILTNYGISPPNVHRQTLISHMRLAAKKKSYNRRELNGEESNRVLYGEFNRVCSIRS